MQALKTENFAGPFLQQMLKVLKLTKIKCIWNQNLDFLTIYMAIVFLAFLCSISIARSFQEAGISFLNIQKICFDECHIIWLITHIFYCILSMFSSKTIYFSPLSNYWPTIAFRKGYFESNVLTFANLSTILQPTFAIYDTSVLEISYEAVFEVFRTFQRTESDNFNPSVQLWKTVAALS